MGVWCEVDGYITINKDDHFSIAKYTGETFEVIKPVVSTRDNKTSYTYYVHFNFLGDGRNAYDSLLKWLKGFPEKTTYDIDATIRFIK